MICFFDLTDFIAFIKSDDQEFECYIIFIIRDMMWHKIKRERMKEKKRDIEKERKREREKE
jgi:hypothetical protein